LADKYIIQGKRALKGEVQISGSKNAALGIIAAAMVVDGPSVIENLPQIQDIKVLLEICQELGAEIDWINGNTIRLDPTTIILTKQSRKKFLRSEVHIISWDLF